MPRQQQSRRRGVKIVIIAVAAGRGGSRITVGGNVVVIVSGIHESGGADLLELGSAMGVARPFPGRTQCRQQHRRQNRDDSNHNQELDQRKQELFSHGASLFISNVDTAGKFMNCERIIPYSVRQCNGRGQFSGENFLRRQISLENMPIHGILQPKEAVSELLPGVDFHRIFRNFPAIEVRNGNAVMGVGLGIRKTHPSQNSF
ncbi:hypothetical protein SDC9_118678 [bioreactor metagenome]|uniref:Uncharacterized protein n=1 Tax=bioreactor metagenome TaxID=1076179 RepID=A0A645C2X6_9ZZZZ